MQEATLSKARNQQARPISLEKMHMTAESFSKVKSDGNLSSREKDEVVLESCHKVSRKIDGYLLSPNTFFNVRHLKNKETLLEPP